MSAPALSFGAREVLAALALGIELKSDEEGWKFTSPWQHKPTSGVATEHVSELLDARLARRNGTDRVEITERGLEALASINRAIVDEGMRWLRSNDSPSEIC